MATVVRLGRDTRAAELGAGVAGFLNRMRDRRLDGLQQELMSEITASQDEAEASALFGDPRFQDVVGDPNRFAAITTHLNNAPLGRTSLTGYDREGNQQLITISERDDPAQALKDRGLSLERSRLFYAVDQDNPDDLGTSLGRFNSQGDARESLGDSDSSDITIMDQEEFGLSLQTRASEIAIGQRQQGIDLDRERFDFARNSPTTVFTNLIEDFRQGKINTDQFNQSWDKLTFKGFGRTQFDVQSKTEEEMQEQGALVAVMSERGLNYINQIIENPELISKAGSVVRGFENVAAELSATARLTGLTWEDPNGADNFDFGGFAAHSTAFKNSMMDFAIIYAASKGQTNRALSDKDFDRFLTRVGSDISNPDAFIVNMATLMAETQSDFNITHRRLQGFNYEDVFGSFARFEPQSSKRREMLQKNLSEKFEGLEFRLANPKLGAQ